MRFRLAPISMTLDDLELENNLPVFSSLRRQYLANSTQRCRALTFVSAKLSCCNEVQGLQSVSYTHLTLPTKRIV